VGGSWAELSQIHAIKQLLATEALNVEDICCAIQGGAKTDLVRRHVDILLVMGEVQHNPDQRYQGSA
jgi:hypothetical protein